MLGFMGLFLLPGCGGDDAPAVAPPLTAEQRLNLGVVAVDARIGDDRVRSSGTVIDPEGGLVLTSAHGVWGATSLRVTTGLGVLHGRIVARAPCDDLALVEVAPRVPGLVALPVGTQPPPSSDLLTAVGRREADPDLGTGSLVTIPTRTAKTGVVASLGGGLRPLTGVLRLDAPIVPESSGGPVVDGKGRLVGVAMATEAGARHARALAVPWSAVQARLDELQPGPRRVFVGWREQYRCAPRLHAYAAAEHPGYRRIDARINSPVPSTRLTGTQEIDQ